MPQQGVRFAQAIANSLSRGFLFARRVAEASVAQLRGAAAAREPGAREAARVAGAARVLSLLLLLAAACVAERAEAHATSTSYLVAQDDGHGEVNITWDVAVADVHWALGLDADGDGNIAWREIEARRADIAALAQSHLVIARGPSNTGASTHTRAPASCPTQLTDLFITTHAGEPHLSLAFLASCSRAAAAAPAASGAARTLDTSPLSITANLFFDKDATQRTLIDISTTNGQFTSILSPAEPTWSEPKAPSALHTFTTFTAQGLWHVWIGYDHLAFLLLLILPGVLRAQPLGDLLKIVTAFTVAHSITLALAATGTVHIPVRPIEIAIALSIIIAGLLNLFPKAAKARLGLAFGFGLIHGFGFANALAELGTHGSRLIPTLAGFNVGVELAQISLVALVLPFLLRARNSMFYAWRFMPAASLAAAMAGAAWVAARVG
jgi:hypothetical protein